MTNEVLLETFTQEVKERTLENTDSYFKLNALVGELGEYANLLKKQKYYEVFDTFHTRVDDEIKNGIRKPWKEREIDELGDVLFYYIQLIQSRNLDIYKIIEEQLKKLAKSDDFYAKKFKK
jgi:NTP pyrophosphatase (non-canonical NTP hydrolase)